MVEIKCKQCGQGFKVIPARKDTAKFCSYACRGVWQTSNWRGKNNPAWQGGDRVKTCRYCKKEFKWNGKEAASVFRAKKFCSKSCADQGGFRYKGEKHPRYKESARRRSRNHHHSRWADKVIARDNGTCQHCGAKDAPLHAHHIKPFKDYPDLRDDVDNGLTLCAVCHWDVHSADRAKGVNSGELSAGKAGDNPEPSIDGNVFEGVTTNGRAYRRWYGECAWCGKFISRRPSDVKGKSYVACSYSCSGKYAQYMRGNGSKPDTSALHVK